MHEGLKFIGFDYKTIIDHSQDRFEERVKELLNLKEDWELQGGVAIGGDSRMTYYAQAFIKEIYEEIPGYWENKMKLIEKLIPQ